MEKNCLQLFTSQRNKVTEKSLRLNKSRTRSSCCTAVYTIKWMME